MRSVALFILGAIAGLAVSPGEQPGLRARFLGNAALEITDGDFTLLVDFPYQSGAFGYMTYDPVEIRARPKSVCLFTHAHADHFDPQLVARIGCTVVGPVSVESRAAGAKSVPLSKRIFLHPLTITPMPTDHGGEPHDSYLVEWRGLRLYFTGDTDSVVELVRQGSVDALFITPWLLAKARAAGALPDAGRTIVYHHRSGERIVGCSECLVPRQGQTFELSTR